MDAALDQYDAQVEHQMRIDEQLQDLDERIDLLTKQNLDLITDLRTERCNADDFADESKRLVHELIQATQARTRLLEAY